MGGIARVVTAAAKSLAEVAKIHKPEINLEGKQA